MVQCFAPGSSIENIKIKLKRRHIKHFAMLWNYYSFSIKGPDSSFLVDLANKVRLNQWALKKIKSYRTRAQLLAMVTLGNLREKRAEDILKKKCEKSNYLLALTALRSLLRIDPKNNISYFINLIVEKENWPQSQVAQILKETGADIISKPLARAIISARDESKPRLIRLLQLAHAHETFSTLKEVLKNTNNPEVISAAMSILNDPICIVFAKQYLHHEMWFVRVQAARVIGRLGTKQDAKILYPLLSDSHWWVRYRAAEALALLPMMTVSELQSIKESQTDPFAQDIMSQIIAEGICR